MSLTLALISLVYLFSGLDRECHGWNDHSTNSMFCIANADDNTFDENLKTIDRYLKEGKLELMVELFQTMPVTDSIKYFTKAQDVALEIKRRCKEKCKFSQPKNDLQFTKEQFQELLINKDSIISNQEIDLTKLNPRYGARAPVITMKQTCLPYSTFIVDREFKGELQSNILYLSGGGELIPPSCSIIISNDDLSIQSLQNSIVIARGEIKHLLSATKSVIICKGDIPNMKEHALASAFQPRGDKPPSSALSLNEAKPLDWIVWFEPKSVGLTVSVKDGVVTIDTLDPKREYATSGCKVGDRIVKINEVRPTTENEFRRHLMRAIVSGKIELQLERGDKKSETIKLAFPVKE